MTSIQIVDNVDDRIMASMVIVFFVTMINLDISVLKTVKVLISWLEKPADQDPQCYPLCK